MDNNSFDSPSLNNGSVQAGVGGGGTNRAGSAPSSLSHAPPRPASLAAAAHCAPNVVRVVVNKDERGYGMNVSGDNPVYVQRVKQGGAAEKAGLHAGDLILEVNGVNVVRSTHKEVVSLIKSSCQVVLTVQQRIPNVRPMTPNMHRPVTTPTSARITGPQPVDHKKQYQLQQEKEQYYRLMIEKEQTYLEVLRSQLVHSPDEKKAQELVKTERNLQTLQAMLSRSQAEQLSPSPSDGYVFGSVPASHPRSPHRYASTAPLLTTPNNNSSPCDDQPPPLPKRNNRQRSNTVNGKSPTKQQQTPLTSKQIATSPKALDINAAFLTNEINANLTETPPPLPPRQAPGSDPPNLADGANSINKQMSYPLVATLVGVVDNSDSPPNPTHHRTKSSPETLSVSPTRCDRTNKKLSESMNDLSKDEWERRGGDITPPGTPPPPYPSPRATRRGEGGEDNEAFEETIVDGSSPDVSPFRNTGSSRFLGSSSPIHAANPQTVQQPIMSMEDDEISDQEISQLEDHGHFKSLSRLREHLPHLAVFMNYILSNSDPNSLLFFLLTDLYKEGNAREMRKWAFEIHSCFLIPGSPLHLGNVGEDVATEIDGVLQRDFDKEEILRKIFWKARVRAKEELTRQLAHFQQKRTAGLGTMYGPSDQELAEIYNDKTRETRLYENLFLPKVEPYMEELEKDSFDAKRYYTAAALTTVITRIFQIGPKGHLLEKCPTFVSKEKSFRTKLMPRNFKKLIHLGHHFTAQPYYSVIACNNCHQIIYGISPQGYQCAVCLINLHRTCVKLYDDTCPGPIKQKDSRIKKFIRMSHDSGDHNRIKKTSNFLQMEKERRQLEESRDSSFEIIEAGDSKGGQPVSRSGSDRRPDSVKEEQQQGGGGAGSANGSGGGAKESNGGSPLGGSGDRVDELQGGPAHGVNERGEPAGSDSSVSLPASGNRKKIGSNINRSESWKEQSEKRKQKRNISDPSHNASCDVELEKQQGLSNTDSGSSSHSSLSCNGRLSESPCTSAEVVHQAAAHARTRSDTDSDADGETEPLNWQERVPEEELRKLNQLELKRQEVINELFSTEGSHVRSLKVLYRTFYKRLSQSQLLKPDELALIFPNIKELLDVHQEINDEMRRKRRDDPIVKELGDLMVKTFCGPTGETIRRASATFCQRQRLALEFITKRRERDTKFDALLADCEKKRACRRLPLQGILPTQMQRLSKYPLLLERLIGTVENGSEEEDKLRKAHDLSKEILQHVNEAAKVAMNQHRLEDIQRRLDTSAVTGELRALDLTCHRLVLEGGMQLRRPNKAPVPVHVLLLEEMVVILHRDGDRFLLKLFQSGSSAQPQPLSPIIKMNTLLVRNNAVCKNALFLFNTSTTNNQPPTMYDLVAENESKREEWFKNFSEAAEAYTHREGGKPGRRSTPAPSTSSAASVEVADLPTASEEEPEPRPPDAHQPDTEAVQKEDGTKDGEDDKTARDSSTDDVDQNEGEGGGAMVASGVGSGGDVVRQSRVAADDWPLVQPSQLSVSAPDVHTAERMLTPLEQIRRKDALVKQALADKEGLVADLLSIPREHYHHIADMASDMTLASSRDITERVMASIFQVDQLQKAVNAALNVTEAEAVEAKGGKVPSCASQNIPEKPTVPSVPAGIVRDIAASLSSQLTTLLSDVKQIEEERDRLRREICKFREILHEEHNLHGPPPTLQEESEEANNNGNEATESTETPEVEKVSGGNEKDDVFYETSGDNQ